MIVFVFLFFANNPYKTDQRLSVERHKVYKDKYILCVYFCINLPHSFAWD